MEDNPTSDVAGAWSAAGFGMRFVADYLAGGLDSSEPAPQGQSTTTPDLAVEAVEQLGEEYWAVSVTATDASGEGQQFWRVGVLRRNGELVATGLPAPVAAPAVELDSEKVLAGLETPPSDDPVVETVEGWVAAYACGRGDASRYLAPGTHVASVHPPLCSEVRLDRWAATEDGPDRQFVTVEGALDPGSDELRVAVSLVLTLRDGRWEIAELLPAPPLLEEVDGE